MKKTCDNVHLQELTHRSAKNGEDVHMWNVIGEQNWKDAAVHVLLMAHWDSRPTANEDPDPENRTKPIPGANDGASGVAVLLELARAIKDRHPGVGIMYVMDDGEDLGPGIDEMFLGADFFAKNLPSPKPDYGILLDMIGDKDLAVPMEKNSRFRAETLTRAFYSNAMKIGLSKTFPYEMGPEILDDHLTLNDHGVPTMDLIDFTYAPWHTLKDTPEYCSAESLKKVGVALESFLLRPRPFKP
jgi:glutaminyl-peptide cyclotransferase